LDRVIAKRGIPKAIPSRDNVDDRTIHCGPSSSTSGVKVIAGNLAYCYSRKLSKFHKM
jgi:hypothetical protein